MAEVKQQIPFEGCGNIGRIIICKVVGTGHEVELTTKEYEMLCLPAANKGRILTYAQIYDKA